MNRSASENVEEKRQKANVEAIYGRQAAHYAIGHALRNVNDADLD